MLSIASCAYTLHDAQRRCTNQGAWVFVTPRRPNANSGHTGEPRVWTWTPSRDNVQRVVLFLIHFPVSLIRLLPACHFDLVGWRYVWGLFVEQTGSLQFHLGCEVIRRLTFRQKAFVHLIAILASSACWSQDIQQAVKYYFAVKCIQTLRRHLLTNDMQH